jgi:hypothetical protein
MAELGDGQPGEPAQGLVVARQQQLPKLVPQRVQVRLARVPGLVARLLVAVRRQLHRVAHRRRPPQVEEQVESRPVLLPLEQRGGRGRPAAAAGPAGRPRRAPGWRRAPRWSRPVRRLRAARR